MSEYESLREDIGHVAASLASYSETAVSHLLEQSRQIDKLWADNAELRDDLHALANRVETLTRTALNPYPNSCGRPDCRFTEPHDHDPDDGHVIINHAARI